MCTDNLNRERIETSTSERIYGAIDSTQKARGFSFIFGATGRGKTFTANYWIKQNPGKGYYYRCKSAVTQSKLVRELCAVMCGKMTNATPYQHQINLERHLTESAGKVLIVDESNYMVERSSAKARECLNFWRDIYDRFDVSIVLIFTAYTLDNLRDGVLGGFLEQFRGRQHINLQIPAALFPESEVQKVVESYIPNPPIALLKAAYDIATGDDGKLRALFKYLDILKKLSREKKENRITAANLRKIAERYANGGDWPEESTEWVK